jgi:hypothetical protein
MSDDAHLVLLTGASGYISGRLSPLLEKRGLRLRRLCRQPERGGGKTSNPSQGRTVTRNEVDLQRSAFGITVANCATVILFGCPYSAANQSLWKGADMSFINWVKNCFSHRGKAVSLYRSGMARANKHNYDEAIADYSAAIQEPSVPTDVKAMALYNRALAYSALHEDAKSAEDLATVLEMPGLPQNIRAQAQQRRERIRRRKENTDSR